MRRRGDGNVGQKAARHHIGGGDIVCGALELSWRNVMRPEIDAEHQACPAGLTSSDARDGRASRRVLVRERGDTALP